MMKNVMFQCAKIIKEAMEEKYGGMGFWQVRGRDVVLVLLLCFRLSLGRALGLI